MLGLMYRWREERKRKYPTQQNIERKMAAKETVEQAGGLVEHEDKKVKETPKYVYLSVKMSYCFDIGETNGFVWKLHEWNL